MISSSWGRTPSNGVGWRGLYSLRHASRAFLDPARTRTSSRGAPFWRSSSSAQRAHTGPPARLSLSSSTHPFGLVSATDPSNYGRALRKRVVFRHRTVAHLSSLSHSVYEGYSRRSFSGGSSVAKRHSTFALCSFRSRCCAANSRRAPRTG